MADTRKDIFLLCELQPGVTRAQLVRNLSTMFNKDSATVEKMLDRPRFLIKKNMDAALAAKYQLAIAKAGGVCELIDHEPALAPTALKSAPLTELPQDMRAQPQDARAEKNVDSKKKLLIASLLSLSVLLAVLALLAYQQFRHPAGVALDAVTPGESSLPQTLPELNQRLFSDDRRLSINVPDSWQERKAISEGASIGAANPAAEAYVIVMAEPRDEFPEDYPLSEYTKAVLTLMQTIMKDMQTPVAPRAFRMRGLPAEQLVVTGQVDKNKITYLLTTVETDRGFFQVLSWTKSERYPGNETLMQEISRSFVARSYPEH